MIDLNTRYTMEGPEEAWVLINVRTLMQYIIDGEVIKHTSVGGRKEGYESS